MCFLQPFTELEPESSTSWTNLPWLLLRRWLLLDIKTGPDNGAKTEFKYVTCCHVRDTPAFNKKFAVGQAAPAASPFSNDRWTCLTSVFSCFLCLHVFVLFCLFGGLFFLFFAACFCFSFAFVYSDLSRI